MTPDVSGATLMAMGGSAPEFFTALIGAFKESDVGFGTIVGSAVFNVLFVIGACIVCAKETLVLTWYPLTRDCIWYTVSLIVLSVFFSVVSP
jgi:Ca2+/Na+ antiporter